MIMAESECELQAALNAAYCIVFCGSWQLILKKQSDDFIDDYICLII